MPAFLSDPTPQTSAARPPGAHAAGSLAGGGRRAGAGEATESPEAAPPCAQHVLVDTRPPRPPPQPHPRLPEPVSQDEAGAGRAVADGPLGGRGSSERPAASSTGRVVTGHAHVPPRGRCSKPEPLGISGRGACELPGCFARSPCRGLSGRELRLTPQGPEAELFPHTNPGQGRGRGVGGNQVNSPHTQCGVRTQSCPTRDAVWDFEQGEGLAVNGHTCGVQ